MVVVVVSDVVVVVDSVICSVHFCGTRVTDVAARGWWSTSSSCGSGGGIVAVPFWLACHVTFPVVKVMNAVQVIATVVATAGFQNWLSVAEWKCKDGNQVTHYTETKITAKQINVFGQKGISTFFSFALLLVTSFKG